MISVQFWNRPVVGTFVAYQTTSSLLHGRQSPNFVQMSITFPSNSRKAISQLVKTNYCDPISLRVIGFSMDM